MTHFVNILLLLKLLSPQNSIYISIMARCEQKMLENITNNGEEHGEEINICEACGIHDF